MNKKNELREAVADLCHEQWAGWMTYLFNKGSWNDDETFVIPSKSARKWRDQSETLYSELSLKEQDSDRAEADEFIKLFKKFEKEK